MAVDVRGTERVAVVDERWVDHLAALGVVQQVAQVAQVAEAGADAVPRAVLVQ